MVLITKRREGIESTSRIHQDKDAIEILGCNEMISVENTKDRKAYKDICKQPQVV
jgi:hypothetical protein